MPLVHKAHDQVVVTGGAGFIGSHLVDAILASGVARVTVLDNLHRGRIDNLDRWHGDPRLNVTIGDVRDLETVRSALDRATLVYHLAAQSTVMGAAKDPDYTFTTNVVGTYNVLKAAAEKGVRRVVFASSREVYGEPVSLPVDESHPLFSINIYGASKVAGEALCRALTREHGLDTTVLRLANVYGERDIDRVIPRWIAQARSGNDLVVYGGEQILDFIWVGDVTRAFIGAADSLMPLPPINVANGTGTKILDLARRIMRLAGSPGEVHVVPGRPIEVTRFVGTTDRMTQFLGVAPATDPLAQLGGMVRAVAVATA
jgi:UDP-glucose 4-epimerase